MNWEPWTGCYKVSDGVTERINPFKQGSAAKSLDISISDEKK